MGALQKIDGETRGGPSKLKGWIEEAFQLLQEDMAVIIHTDEDLVDEVNDRIWLKTGDPDIIISQRTFQRWKAQALEAENDPDMDQELSEAGRVFCRLVKIALRRERRILISELKMRPAGDWQKIAWILERKFSHWNLKHVSENTDTTVRKYIIDDGDPEDIG